MCFYQMSWWNTIKSRCIALIKVKFHNEFFLQGSRDESVTYITSLPSETALWTNEMNPPGCGRRAEGAALRIPATRCDTKKNPGALCRDYGSRFIVSSNERELSEAGGLSIKGTLRNGRLLKAPLKFLDSALAEKPRDKLADPLPYKLARTYRQLNAHSFEQKRLRVCH